MIFKVTKVNPETNVIRMIGNFPIQIGTKKVNQVKTCWMRLDDTEGINVDDSFNIDSPKFEERTSVDDQTGEVLSFTYVNMVK